MKHLILSPECTDCKCICCFYVDSGECANLQLQCWTKVLGVILQYSCFSVISRFPLKTVCQRFRHFLAVLLPPTLYKVETQKKILDTPVQHCLWGEGRDWTCVRNWKTPQKCKSVPRLLSMIVVLYRHSLRQPKFWEKCIY